MNTLNRRDFSSVLLAGTALGSLASSAAQAQGAPVEGVQYTRLPSVAPVTVPAGKVEVVEFFMYSCPHCFDFDPLIDAWAKKLPADVSFRRIPLAFRPNLEPHQRLYFALESLGWLDALHTKAFRALHVEHRALMRDDDIQAWATAAGFDGARLVEMMKSFTVAGKVRPVRALAEAYRIDGVPTLGIHGRWTTSGAQAGTHEKALLVTDYLINQARKLKA